MNNDVYFWIGQNYTFRVIFTLSCGMKEVNCYCVWAINIQKYDDLNKTKLTNPSECHSSIGPRKWKKFVQFCELSLSLSLSWSILTQFDECWHHWDILMWWFMQTWVISNRHKDAFRDIKLCITHVLYHSVLDHSSCLKFILY